jgi:HEAT repeat protein
VWGKDDLVARVAAENNHAYVSDLAEEPELVAWLDEVGITAWEAARIQVPGGVPPGEEDTPSPDTDTPGPGGPPTAVPETPPPATPDPGATDSGGTTGEGGDRPASSGPTGGAPGGGGSLGGPPGGGRTDPGPAALGEESWWLWWELNKLDYLTANPLRVRLDAITGVRTKDGEERHRKEVIARRRAAALPMLETDLRHADARVRAAAVIAVGRVGGPSVVPKLVAVLDDPQRWVRERAILALGATGSSEAGDLLLRIARTGSHVARGKTQLSPNARPLAILSLGLLGCYRGESGHDAAVAEIVAKSKKRDLEHLGSAGLLHGILSPGERVEAMTLRISMDPNAPDPVRARAVERLGALMNGEAMPALQRLLAGKRMELRRSAAVGLGEVEHGLVLPRLMTSFELEKEPLTRAFLLLAIARHGGEKASRFLTRQLEDGPDVLRPWAALAVGLVARSGDSSVLPVLRKTEIPGADQGAVWLALGLARDTESIPALKAALGRRGSPRARAHAATALALVAGERARHALLSRQTVESSPGVQVVIAHCLGVLGKDDDAEIMLRTLRGATRPSYAGVMAVGLGYHGGDEMLTGLTDLLGESGLDPVVRGTAITAIGLLLDRRPGLEFPALSRRTNFAMAPSWLFPVLLSTL